MLMVEAIIPLWLHSWARLNRCGLFEVVLPSESGLPAISLYITTNHQLVNANYISNPLNSAALTTSSVRGIHVRVVSFRLLPLRKGSNPGSTIYKAVRLWYLSSGQHLTPCCLGKFVAVSNVKHVVVNQTISCVRQPKVDERTVNKENVLPF